MAIVQQRRPEPAQADDHVASARQHHSDPDRRRAIPQPQQQHGGADPYGLVKYLRTDETASRLFDENLALARTLRQRNLDNGTLIDLRLRATQNALSVLHAANNGGGTPYDPSQYYPWRNGTMHNGLVVVPFALTAVGPGDGGFAAIPGSHKSNLPCPDDFKTFTKTGPWVVQVPQPAGSIVIFTEALTHGTWPWTAAGERRSLLYKFSPGHMSWLREYPAAADVPETADDPELQRIMEPLYVQQRAHIVE